MALILGLNVSAKDPILKQQLSLPHYPGPFIIMLQRANIPGLANVVNVVMIIAAISVANADIYVGVKSYAVVKLMCRVERFTLYHAKDTHLHFFEGKTHLEFRTGRLWFRLYRGHLHTWARSFPRVMSFFCRLKSNTQVFGFLSSTTALIISWAIICMTYLRLRRAIKVRQLEHVTVREANSRFQPLLAIYGLSCCIFLSKFPRHINSLMLSFISRF